MRIKKKILGIILVINILILTSCSKTDPLITFMADESGVKIDKGEELSEFQTIPGFHGDGVKIIKMGFSDGEIEEEIKNSKKWKSLPLEKNLKDFIYEPYDENINIPEIENGYYFFYDRNRESIDPYDSSELFNRNSYNFSLAIYNLDTNEMYLIEEDT